MNSIFLILTIIDFEDHFEESWYITSQECLIFNSIILDDIYQL